MRVFGFLMVIGCVAGNACGDGSVWTSDMPETETRDSIVGGKLFSGMPAVGALTVFGEEYCTATLVGGRQVLTAGHCVEDVEASAMQFVIGADIAHPDHALAVASVRPHPDYDPRTLDNDIGLVTLAVEAPVAPLPCLPAMDATWAGTDLFFVGYGVTSPASGRSAGRKRSVWISIAEVGARTFVYADPGKNTCYGDSGGPAFFIDADETPWIAGVTSWGDAGCTHLGVDTRVDAYADFIAACGETATQPPVLPPPADASDTETIEGVSFTATQADAVLELVNTAAEAVLDVEVGLDSRAAANIVAARPFATIAELAAVPYVGPSALKKLKAYACP